MSVLREALPNYPLLCVVSPILAHEHPRQATVWATRVFRPFEELFLACAAGRKSIKNGDRFLSVTKFCQ